MIQMYNAKMKKITPEMEKILKNEKISKEFLLKNIAKGRIVIIPNRKNEKHVALGDGLKSKIISNIGTSSNQSDPEKIYKMIEIANEYGVDLLCDLSVGGDLSSIRRKLIDKAEMPLASIPLYQTSIEAKRKRNSFHSFTASELIKTFEIQVKDGISAPGIHTLTKKLVEEIDFSSRLIPIASRGGGLLYEYIKENNCENPYIESFDEILSICYENDVPITLITATRSGCLADGLDKIQLGEWKVMRNLIKQAHSKNIGVIVNGVGHLRMDKIPKAISLFKKITLNVPIGVMGPAITDRALGFEHIAHALGAAIAIQNGANYCQTCCRTEHVGLPDIDDFIESINTYKVAIYGGDLTKFPYFQQLENKISQARFKNQWGKQLNLAINQKVAIETFYRVGPKENNKQACSICGNLCPFLYMKKKS